MRGTSFPTARSSASLFQEKASGDEAKKLCKTCWKAECCSNKKCKICRRAERCERCKDLKMSSSKPICPSDKAEPARNAVFWTAELLENILSFLPARDIVAVQRVTRIFKDNIDSSPYLQRQIGGRERFNRVAPNITSDVEAVTLNEAIFLREGDDLDESDSSRASDAFEAPELHPGVHKALVKYMRRKPSSCLDLLLFIPAPTNRIITTCTFQIGPIKIEVRKAATTHGSLTLRCIADALFARFREEAAEDTLYISEDHTCRWRTRLLSNWKRARARQIPMKEYIRSLDRCFWAEVEITGLKFEFAAHGDEVG